MSVFSSVSDSSRAPLDVIFISCISATLGSLVTQPFDVLKTRLQVPPILHAQPSIGILRTAFSLWTEVPSSQQNRWVYRGRLFWAGTVHSLWRSVPGICGYFFTLNFLQSHFSGRGSTTANAFALGFTSRCIVGGLLLPFTVVKSHAEAGLTGRRSTLSALRWIYSTTKWRGVFSGLFPTLARDSTYSGAYLLFYTQFKNFLLPSGISDSTAPAHLLSLCALFGAFCATAITQPADVLRSNRQLSIVNAAVNGTPNKIFWPRVLLETVRIDGISGLWRGFYLRLVRRGVFAVITWTLFDKIPRPSQSPQPLAR